MLGLFESSYKVPLAALLEHIEGFSQPRRRRHELWVATCYIRAGAVQELIIEVEKRVRLTKVTVVYEQSELLIHADLHTKLESLRVFLDRNHSGMEVSFTPVDAGAGLFHGKGYAVVQLDHGNGGLRDAALLLTSGNCTSWGIGAVNEASKTNTELGLITNTFRDVQRFVEFVKKSECGSKTPRTGKASVTRFRRRVLLDARYLCKWDGSLRQQLSTIFKLDRTASKSPTELDPELKAMGFSLETNSLSKCYFDMASQPRKAFPAFVKKRYTVQTILGHWMPLHIWRVIEDYQAGRDIEAVQWIDKILERSSMRSVQAGIHSDLEILLKRGYRFEGANPFAALERRINELRSNSIRRQRILTGYEALPFLANSEDEDIVDEVFESLTESIESRSRQNVAARLLREAAETLDFRKVHLNAEQVLSLQHDLGEATNERDGAD